MLRTILQSVGISLLSVGFGFVLSILLARFLGPEARGIYGSLLTIAILIAGFAQLGLAHGYVYQKRKTSLNAFSVIVKSGGIIALVAGLLLLIMQSFFLVDELAHYLVLLLLLAFVTSYHQYFQNSAQIDQNLHFYNGVKITLPVLNIIALASCYYFFEVLNVEIAISILVVTTFVSALILAINVIGHEWQGRKLSQLKLSNIVNYSSKIYGTSTIGIAINSIDKIVLLGIGTMKEFGLYSVAFGLSRLIGIIPDTLSTVVYSRFAGKNENQLASVVRQIFAGLFLPLLTICLFLACLASWLISFLFGVDYADATWPFVILLFESVISSLGWLLSQRFNAAGRPGLVFFRQAVSTIPLIGIIFYPFENNILIVVSSALLLSSIIRLLMTVILYKKVLHEPAPSLYLTITELKQLYSQILPNRLKG
ncbi:MAG: lipopolysaccharide biosynthesis protein [Thalassotalea sp.]